jgi:hypothetical protein
MMMPIMAIPNRTGSLIGIPGISTTLPQKAGIVQTEFYEGRGSDSRKSKFEPAAPRSSGRREIETGGRRAGPESDPPGSIRSARAKSF